MQTTLMDRKTECHKCGRIVRVLEGLIDEHWVAPSDDAPCPGSAETPYEPGADLDEPTAGETLVDEDLVDEGGEGSAELGELQGKVRALLAKREEQWGPGVWTWLPKSSAICPAGGVRNVRPAYVLERLHRMPLDELRNYVEHLRRAMGLSFDLEPTTPTSSPLARPEQVVRIRHLLGELVDAKGPDAITCVKQHSPLCRPDGGRQVRVADIIDELRVITALEADDYIASLEGEAEHRERKADADTAPPVVPKRTKLPRAACPACSRDVALRKNGAFREHSSVAGSSVPVCEGSGKTLEELAEEPTVEPTHWCETYGCDGSGTSCDDGSPLENPTVQATPEHEVVKLRDELAEWKALALELRSTLGELHGDPDDSTNDQLADDIQLRLEAAGNSTYELAAIAKAIATVPIERYPVPVPATSVEGVAVLCSVLRDLDAEFEACRAEGRAEGAPVSMPTARWIDDGTRLVGMLGTLEVPLGTAESSEVGGFSVDLCDTEMHVAHIGDAHVMSVPLLARRGIKVELEPERVS